MHKESSKSSEFFCGFQKIVHGKTPLNVKAWFFFILFPLTYLKLILIMDTNKVLESLMDTQEFIRWVDC